MAAQATRHTVVAGAEGPPLPRFEGDFEGDFEGGFAAAPDAAAFIAAANGIAAGGVAGDGAPGVAPTAALDSGAAAAMVPRRKRSRPAESAAREMEAQAEAERRAAAEALAAVERAEKAEAGTCGFCGKLCANPGSLKNHQKTCKAKRHAEDTAAAAAREKKRAARIAKQHVAAAAAEEDGQLPRAAEGELACGLCGKRCGNGGALARHVAVCAYKAGGGGGGLSLAVAQRNATRLPGTPEPSHAPSHGTPHGSGTALVAMADDNPPPPQQQQQQQQQQRLQRFGPMSDGVVADWLSAVQRGRYVAEYGGAITYHFADMAELTALARLTRLGIDNVLKRVGVERAGVRLVLTAAVRKLRGSGGGSGSGGDGEGAAGESTDTTWC